jgi:hypothetical protein
MDCPVIAKEFGTQEMDEIFECLLAAADMDPNQIDYCGKPALVLNAQMGHVHTLL